MVWIWSVIFILTLVAEILTIELVTIWFSFGSLVAFILALCGVSSTIQIIVFLVVSVVLLACLRTICLRFLRNSKEKTNLDSLVGKSFTLIKSIESEDPGEIKVNGIVWRVVEKDNNPVQVGEKVVIVEIQGNKFLVKKENN